MSSLLKFAVTLLCTCAVAGAFAQGPCTLQTIAGTYAFYEKGSSAILDPNSQPYPYHWAGAIAPFISLGEVTISPNGTGEGFYWIRIGSFNSGADATPFQVAVTELNEDCTGKWQFDFTLMGTTYTIEERFVLFDNGRQLRSVPTITGIPTMAWIGEGHRISKPGESLANCGPHTARGTYVLSTENLVRMGTNPIFADAALLKLNFLNGGNVTGTLYEKLGIKGDIQLPVWGTISVNPDCSFDSALNVVVQGVPSVIPMRGVFMDEGKKLYGLNVNSRAVGTQYSFGQGERIGPVED